MLTDPAIAHERVSDRIATASDAIGALRVVFGSRRQRQLVVRRIVAVIAAFAVFSIGERASADTIDLFPTAVENNVDWLEEPDVIGNPNCTGCVCQGTVPFAYNPEPTITYLRVTDFANLPFTSGYTITRVNLDAQCTYDSGVTGGIVRMFGIYGSNESYGGGEMSFNSTSNCAYRFGSDGDLVPPDGVRWQPSQVNQLGARIRRITMDGSKLRVRTMRIQVTYFPDADGDGTPDSSDCAPTNPAIATPRTFYRDADGDGFGNAGVTTTVCQLTPPAGYVTNSTDCNDANAAINPNTVWYQDVDGDGVGVSGTTLTSCAQPSGYALATGDPCPRVRNTDVNGNGITDCVECTRVELTLWSNEVVEETPGSWTNPGGVETNPTCGNVCDCNSTGGSYATNSNTQWLIATGFNGLSVPSGYVGAVVRIDGMARSGVDEQTTLRMDALLGSSTLFADQLSITSSDGNCRYLLDQPTSVQGFLNLSSQGGSLSAAALSDLQVRIRRATGADLRVRSLRLYVLLVPESPSADADGDCIADSSDNCPTVANASQANADGDSFGDACDVCPNYAIHTDGNGNGITDCAEVPASYAEDTYYALSVPNLPSSSAWRSETVAAGDPGCASNCNCNTLGTYAYNGNVGEPGDVSGDTTELVANFNINIPSNRVPVEVYVDVLARYDDEATESTQYILSKARVNGTAIWSDQVSADNPTGDITCKWRHGTAGFIRNVQGVPWTRQHLQSLTLETQRNGALPGNALRVKGFKVRVKTVEIDSDGDGKVDSADNCDFVANVDQADCDSNGVGNACEAALFPLRDSNDDGVVDACQAGIAGWTGEAGDGSWSNPNNWSNRLVPGTGTNVTLESTSGSALSITVPAGLSIGSLTIDNNTRATLTMAGGFTVNGACSIGNGAQLSLAGSGGERTLAVNGAMSVGQAGTLDLSSSARIAVAQNFTCFAQSAVLLTLRPVAVGTAPITIGGTATMNASISIRTLGLTAAQLTVGTKYPAVRFNGTIANGRTGNGFLVPDLSNGRFLREEVVSALPPATLQFVVTNLAQFLALAGSSSTALGGGPTAIVAGDFFPDATGLQSDDYVVTTRQANPSIAGSIYSFKNNGDGTFQQLGVVGAMVDPIAVEKSDLDADVRKDIVVLGGTSRVLQVFTNTGDASPAAFPFAAGSSTSVGAPGDTPIDFAIAPKLAALGGESLVETRGVVVVSQRVAADGTVDGVQQAARISGGVFLAAPANGAVVVTNEPAGPIDPSPETRESAQFSERLFHATLSEQSGGTSGSLRGLSVNATGQLVENFVASGSLALPIDTQVADVDLDGFDDLVAVGDQVSAATATTERSYVVAVFRGTAAGAFDTGEPTVFAVDPTPDDGVAPLRPLDLTIGNLDGLGGSDIAVALGEITGSGQEGRHVRTFVNKTFTPPGGGVPPVEFETNADNVTNEGEGVLRIRAAQVIAGAVNEGFVKMGNTVPNFDGGSYFFGDGLVAGPFSGATAFQPQTQPLCVDQNGDGDVDSLDLGIVLGAWGTLGYGPSQIGNVDLIGTVDAADIATLIANWGPCGAD
jgi:hypothetical protein